MIAIPPGNFLRRGGLIPEGEEEIRVIIKALSQERDRVIMAGEDHYGNLPISRINKIICCLEEIRGA